ncbi:hypothetical protein CPCC7001_1321 [Cyanobium sp. PCC 7001]|uniref:hypothetical protein n=1 Tax=Cyanobium sp. PCC 7001 TaxID=180281 RepID=UPI000180529C|nr:hypothetical protein [Cyanobium sp. PCC 7001]EDY38442.1 hypothetical protein CPCC7001_1321 [Cyanobium sp. PCC 7001]
MALRSPLPTTLPRLLISGGCLTAATLALALGSFTPAIGQTSAPPERLTPAQKEKIFPEVKALMVKKQQQSIKIQEDYLRCTRAASNQEALRSCKKADGQSRRKLRAETREERRKIYARNGIEVPVGGPGKGRKGAKRSGGGGA